MARQRERVSLESGLKLDLNHLIRCGLVAPGKVTRHLSRWTLTGTDEVVAEAIIDADMRPDAFSQFVVRQGAGSQVVALCFAYRHFGGRQWYFTCPKTSQRVSVLWKPPGSPYFASREAFGRQVAYGTQFETPRDRAITAGRKIRRRLGDNWLSCFDGPPPKPKGMRWRTYNRLVDECEAREAFAVASLCDYVRKPAS